MTEMYNNELLPLTNDYVFRRVFGERNPGALADFLASVTNIPLGDLQSLEIDDPNLHRKYRDGKSGELDVRVHTKNGNIINIEIQVNSENAFRERIVYYSDRLFAGQLGRGDAYKTLNRTITIVITDFVLISENSDYFNTFRWYNEKNGALLSDMQEINTLELPKLPESGDDTLLWHWMKLLKLREEREMETLAKGNQAMKDVIMTVREMSADEAERRLAEAREKEWRDRQAEIEYASEFGEVRGEKNKAMDVARRMKANGYSADEIARITDIAISEIETL